MESFVDPPLAPEDKPTREEFAEVAWRLILELADDNPGLARTLWHAVKEEKRATPKASRSAA